MIRKKQHTTALCGMMLLLTVFGALPSVTAQEPPVADANGPYIVDECQPVLFDASGSYSPDGGSLEYRWNFDGTWTDWMTYPYTEYTWRDDYQGTITLEVRENDMTAQDTADITVFNTAPYIVNITGPTAPVAVGALVVITMLFGDGDPRMDPSLDTYVATFYWGDGTTSEYTVAAGVFEVAGSHSYDQPGEYTIFIDLIDDNGGQASGQFYITVIDDETEDPTFHIDIGPEGFIDEGSLFVSGGSFESSAGTLFTATVDYGDGSGQEPLPLNADRSFELNHHYGENGLYEVVVTIVEDEFYTLSDSTQVTVFNVAPMITSLTAPADPLSLGTSIMIAGDFIDPGCLDTYTVLIEWDDGQQTVIELAAGIYHADSNHVYTSAGVYTITFMVTDDDGGSDSQVFETYVVIYDPSSGFVTGGGWIIALPGSYPANPDLTGRCNFGFVSKYKRGQHVPEGNTEFQFQLAGLNFHSHTYDWLVIAGAKAMYRGVGTINGQGNYGFMLTGIDGQKNGGGGVDKFRMKIWDIDQDSAIVFDNNLGASDDSNPTTMLSGGQITIHKA